MVIAKIGKKIMTAAQILANWRAFSFRRGITVEFIGLNKSWLIESNVNTVIDIGAHKGIFAIMIHQVLPKAQIYSFEPLEECYKQLKKRMMGISNFRAFNVALGDINGELEFHKNEYSQSSSALSMTDLHKQNYPFAAKERLTKVKSARLDDVARELKIEDNLLIKIDVQGFEDKVIVGGKNTIEKANILIVETSFQALYSGQPLFEDIYDLLRENFRYMGSLNQYRSSVDGSMLYEDSIFLRKQT